MKLYYNTITNNMVESDTFNGHIVSRDEHGSINRHDDLSHLVLIGDVYDEPIDLKGKTLRLLKVVGGEEQYVQSGTAMDGRIEEGLRFRLQSRGIEMYSTNLVVCTEWIGKTTIAFHTLSGSLYYLEVL
jgi:hypothetical protein